MTYRRTNDFVKQANALHSLVHVFRIKFRKVRHAGKHHADLVPRLRVEFLHRRRDINNSVAYLCLLNEVRSGPTSGARSAVRK